MVVEVGSHSQQHLATVAQRNATHAHTTIP